jgi:hypothetical protein
VQLCVYCCRCQIFVVDQCSTLLGQHSRGIHTGDTAAATTAAAKGTWATQRRVLSVSTLYQVASVLYLLLLAGAQMQ